MADLTGPSMRPHMDGEVEPDLLAALQRSLTQARVRRKAASRLPQSGAAAFPAGTGEDPSSPRTRSAE